MVRRLAAILVFLQSMPLLGQIRQSSLETLPDGPKSIVLTVKSTSPVRTVIEHLNHEYGWLISYEDPLFPQSELVDVAIPQWKKAHPGVPGYLTPTFLEVRFSLTKPAGVQGEEKKILTELLNQFNALPLQEKFTLIDEPSGRSAVVGMVNGHDVLQGTMIGPDALPRTGSEALRLLIEGCSVSSQLPLTVGTTYPKRDLALPPRKTGLSCRAAISSLAAQGGPNLVYEALEDINGKRYVLNFVPARVIESPH